MRNKPPRQFGMWLRWAKKRACAKEKRRLCCNTDDARNGKITLSAFYQKGRKSQDANRNRAENG